MLSLMEELLLLSVQEDKGTISFTVSTGIDFCLTGAILMELELLKRIRVEKKTLDIIDRTPTKNLHLDAALKQIDSSKRSRSPDYWIRKLRSSRKHLRKELLEELVDKALLREEEQQVLMFFNRTVYPLRDIRLRKDIRDRLQRVLLRGETPSPRTSKLIALTYVCHLTKSLVDQEEQKEARKKAKDLSKEDILAQAVKTVIQASTANTGAY